MALNTITQVKLLNGQVVDLVDWTDQPLYSTVDLQSGFSTQEISLFQYVEGDTVPGFGPGNTTTRTATLNDTNIATPGSMASTEEMLVYAIKPEVYAYVLGTTNDFTTRTYTTDSAVNPGAYQLPMMSGQGLEVMNQQLLLELVISQKVYAQASIGYFNKGFGVSGFSAGATGMAPSNNGAPTQEAVRSFVIPHHIGSQEKYRVKLANTSAIEGGTVVFGTGTDGAGDLLVATDLAASIRVNLDGLYKRPTA
jgi:hypothetical protein